MLQIKKVWDPLWTTHGQRRVARFRLTCGVGVGVSSHAMMPLLQVGLGEPVLGKAVGLQQLQCWLL